MISFFLPFSSLLPSFSLFLLDRVSLSVLEFTLQTQKLVCMCHIMVKKYRKMLCMAKERQRQFRDSVVHSLLHFPEQTATFTSYNRMTWEWERSSLTYGFREGTVITGDDGLIVCLKIKHANDIEPLSPLLGITLCKCIQGTQSPIPGYRSTFLCVCEHADMLKKETTG